jgi:DNA-binding transcriptional regulator YhcF (GntR family)
VADAGFCQTGEALTQDSHAALDATQRYSFGLTCAIGAVRAYIATNRASCKRQVSGSIPLTGSQVRTVMVASQPLCVDRFVDRMTVIRVIFLACPRVAKGCVEQLPSGSWRARVYAGIDPITKREIRLKATAKTEQQAHIELGRLLKEASEGRTPESDATVAKLLDEYAAIAPWDVSTRQTNEGFIRRTIKPALGHLEVRKVRGPILDQLYTRLKRCGNLSCAGRPFTEHRNVPSLVINPSDRRPPWQQVSGILTEAIQSGILAPGDELPSITELSTLQGIGTGIIRHALAALAQDGLIIVQHGRPAVVAGDPSTGPRPSRRRPGPGHDCHRAGCRPHVCHPMKPSTIRGIHSILSGAFSAAKRWEWTERNPAESAKAPTTTRKSVQATSPEDVAKVIAEARASSTALGLYLWLVAAWCMSPSTMSSAVGSGSARTPRPIRTAGSPSTRKPAR